MSPDRLTVGMYDPESDVTPTGQPPPPGRYPLALPAPPVALSANVNVLLLLGSHVVDITSRATPPGDTRTKDKSDKFVKLRPVNVTDIAVTVVPDRETLDELEPTELDWPSFVPLRVIDPPLNVWAKEFAPKAVSKKPMEIRNLRNDVPCTIQARPSEFQYTSFVPTLDGSEHKEPDPSSPTAQRRVESTIRTGKYAAEHDSCPKV